ncbi:unnamed protein product [Tilletia controversa]|uniref:PRELI/MSF1 domain-containing protein n=1 Tax=Tilletia controversa TaxID=13291 RepID=A0A8X7SX08_9BASI|nr:hypothetical protein CF328_g3334 [Tilletia controversa]KAE8247972.1 hypothetical protein A4X06_0g4054 [Tilletia controversa]CAD6974176.1 unnamed protein product [Tilletia controversa]CAD6980301.1 unnamed protein product [Tilletia controversa]
MPRTFTAEHDFPYPWAQTALAIYHKYPNPQAAHVVSLDVLSQHYDPIAKQLRLERILGVKQGAPKWAMRALGGDNLTYVREVMVVDPLRKRIEMTSTNMSLSKYLMVKEYITYEPSTLVSPPTSTSISPSPESSSVLLPTQSSDSTAFRQVAAMSSDSFLGASAIEDWSFSRFGDNAAKGRNGLMSVLERLWGPPAVAA